MNKAHFFVNIIAPYNIPLFNRISAMLGGNVCFHFDQAKETNRSWEIINREIAFDYKIENSLNFDRLADTTNNTKVFSTFYFPFFIFKRIWKNKPAVVVSIEFGLRTIFSFLMCRLTGSTLLVMSDVTATTETNVGWIKKTIRRFISRFADGAIARSYKAGAYLQTLGFEKDKIVVAPYASLNGHAVKNTGEVIRKVQMLKAEKPGNFYFLYSGNFTHRKGLDLLIEAVDRLPEDVRGKLVFLLAGGTSEELAALGKTYNEQCYLPLGFLPAGEMGELYKLADCFILPSRADTWALVVNEAVDAGCPVMVSRYAGSADELIEDGKNGIVFDPLNGKEFEDKLMLCFNNRSMLQAYAGRAKEKLTEYNYDVAASRIVETIKRVKRNH